MNLILFLQSLPKIERNEDIGVISVLSFVVSVLLFAIAYLYVSHKKELKEKEATHKAEIKEKERKIDEVIDRGEKVAEKYTDSIDKFREQYYRLLMDLKITNHNGR